MLTVKDIVRMVGTLDRENRPEHVLIPVHPESVLGKEFAKLPKRGNPFTVSDVQEMEETFGKVKETFLEAERKIHEALEEVILEEGQTMSLDEEVLDVVRGHIGGIKFSVIMKLVGDVNDRALNNSLQRLRKKGLIGYEAGVGWMPKAGEP